MCLHHDACAAGNGVNDSIATWVRKRALSTSKFGRWRSLRHDQLTHEDIRDVAQIEALGLLETLTDILPERSGQQMIYSNLANEVGIAVYTVKRWIDLLERLHFGLVVRPRFNVNKALRREPKWFQRD